ncbi:MAG: c-type cytochrome [Gallionella sp.]
MLKLSKFAVVSWGAAALLAFSGVSFAGDTAITANVKNGKKIFENGKPDAGVSACNSCHGPKAMGNDAMGTPRLANIGYVYVVKQLTDFSKDKRTPSGLGMVMNGFAKALTVQERRDISAYVNTLPKSHETSDLKALKEGGTAVGVGYKGKLIVAYGSDGVSACKSCHGYNGRGAAPVYPKIGQQKFVYLVNQLHNWRDGSRTNDPMGQMRAIAKHLSDDDILNAATYLSQAPESTEGNGYSIENEMVLKNIKIVK